MYCRCLGVRPRRSARRVSSGVSSFRPTAGTDLDQAELNVVQGEAALGIVVEFLQNVGRLGGLRAADRESLAAACDRDVQCGLDLPQVLVQRPQRLARRWLSTGVRTSSRGPVFKGLRRNADLAAQRMRHRRGDSHLYELAHEPAWTAKIDDAVVSARPESSPKSLREAPSTRMRWHVPIRLSLICSHAHRFSAEAGQAERASPPVEYRPQGPLRGFPDAGCRRTKTSCRNRFRPQSQGRLEILLALPGEAHDEIEEMLIPGLAARSLRNDRFVFQGGVPALHRREHAVRTGLHREGAPAARAFRSARAHRSSAG